MENSHEPAAATRLSVTDGTTANGCPSLFKPKHHKGSPTQSQARRRHADRTQTSRDLRRPAPIPPFNGPFPLPGYKAVITPHRRSRRRDTPPPLLHFPSAGRRGERRYLRKLMVILHRDLLLSSILPVAPLSTSPPLIGWAVGGRGGGGSSEAGCDWLQRGGFFIREHMDGGVTPGSVCGGRVLSGDTGVPGSDCQAPFGGPVSSSGYLTAVSFSPAQHDPCSSA
ncbi:unnamed protein product [Gadus morhua 'NCC']